MAERRAERLGQVGLGLIALVAVLGLCEGFLRVIGTTDESGRFEIAGRRLRPYPLPIAEVEQKIAQYHAAAAASATFLVYDPALGWSLRPNATSADGLLRSNSQGLRANVDYTSSPGPGTLRIALLGDSFCFGDEIALEDTWGSMLEQRLRADGIGAEVLNFGVNAYGMDQALLRWRQSARSFRPQVVVYGFQPENLLRNLNVFRPLYFPQTVAPFSKPRFVRDGDRLLTVNQPALPPEQLADALRDLPHEREHPTEHALMRHEYYRALYESHWWLASRLVALIDELIDPTQIEGRFAADPEIGRLGAEILHQLSAEVAADGARLIVLHLPRKNDLEDIVARRELWYGAFLRLLDREYRVVHPEAGIDAVPAVLFAPHGHYSRELTRRVADRLVPAVLEAWCSQPGTSAPRVACEHHARTLEGENRRHADACSPESDMFF